MRKLPRGTLDKWLEFDSIEPIGEHRLQNAEITALLHRLTVHTLASYGSDFKPIEIDGYMPPRYRPDKKPAATKADPKKQFEQVASVLGLRKVIEKNGGFGKSS